MLPSSLSIWQIGGRVSYSKPASLWVSFYPAMLDDPRTHAAAEVLHSKYGVPRYVAAPVIVTAWLRLHVHALGEGDDGRIDHLSFRRLAQIAWPESADAPRRFGKLDRIGEALLDAMSTVPAEREEGLVSYGDPVELAPDPAQGAHGIASKSARQISPTGFDVLHAKILRDRKRKREKADESRDGRATAAPAPVPRRATGAATLPPDTKTGRESPSVSPPSAGTPGGRGGGREQHAGRGGRGGGFREGDRTALEERARALLLEADPNVVGYQRGGIDTTLRPGSHYLLQIEARTGDAALRERLERDCGTRDPAPGVLLAAAAPERFEMVVRSVAAKLPSIRADSPDGYIRSTLARTWNALLSKMADDAAEARVAARRAEDNGDGRGTPRSVADLLSEGGEP